MKQYKKKKRKKPLSISLILLSILVIFMSFVFVLSALTTQVEEQQQVSQLTPEMQQNQFIERLAPYAKQLHQKYGVLPSITLGQAILESDWGRSELASKYNNLFGIKAYGNQPKITLSTKEYVNEQWITIQGDFRVYQSFEESMDDHAQLFIHGVDWDPNKYQPVLQAQNFEQAADALQQAGYATDPTYAEKIKQVIIAHQLQKYDE